LGTKAKPLVPHLAGGFAVWWRSRRLNYSTAAPSITTASTAASAMELKAPVATRKEAVRAGTASGIPSPPFPSEWSQYTAILPADCCAGKGVQSAFPFTVLYRQQRPGSGGANLLWAAPPKLLQINDKLRASVGTVSASVRPR
jgi:hypothetical protein